MHALVMMTLGLALLAGAPAASEAPAAPVAVAYAAPQLTVQIFAETPLATVLEAVCAAMQARCALVAQAAQVPLGPRTVEGPWAAVLAQLLAGSGLSYVTVPPGPAGDGQLVLLGPAPPTEELTAAPPAPADLALAPPPGAVPLPFAVPVEEPAPAPPPAPLAPGTPVVLPFPDPHGNPITVPVTNEPIAVLPWPGPDGQPVPMPPPQPDQKLEWPFPPTASAPNP